MRSFELMHLQISYHADEERHVCLIVRVSREIVHMVTRASGNVEFGLKVAKDSILSS